MKAKTIVLFNHKGGVSKTTTTFNLGWKLSTLGKNVLLVDADPQCNLTSLLLGDDFDDYYTNEPTNSANLKDAVRMAFEGKPKPISAIDCFIPNNNPNLFLIPGHMDLSEYDPSLSLALNSNNAISTLQKSSGGFL
ncbi:ParA family protein [Paenibacillus thailandensis]|uniref:ParA family protein n=1 Tax=Paenibacillus thailandensis TaxID=393250 RepID=A0ABW5R697_9BACL